MAYDVTLLGELRNAKALVRQSYERQVGCGRQP